MERFMKPHISEKEALATATLSQLLRQGKTTAQL
jgi:hypothetical protein